MEPMIDGNRAGGEVMAVQTIEREEVQELMRQGAQVLDALPPDDYARQHLPGAVSVPMQKFTTGLVRNLDRDRPTVTYCADNQCDLSARLAARLVVEGFTNVREYAKSLADWSAFGLPLEGDDAQIATAGDLARMDFEKCAPSDPPAEVAERIGDQLCLIVDEDGVLLGRVSAEHLRGATTLREVIDTGPSTFRPDVPLSEMLDWFKRRPKIDAFIITTPDGRPLGVLHRSDTEAAAKQAERREATASARSSGP